jgi:signal transduction histidine kinase
MGLRARLAAAGFVTVTLVFVAQSVYFKLPWDAPEYRPCLTGNIDGLPCRITRKIPIPDFVQYGIVLIVVALLLVPLALWVLAPVRRLVPVVEQVGPQNLGLRIRPGRGRDELKRLGRAVDATMDRIAAGYEAQRTFAANASHELRTPLALQRTLIEVGMADPLSPEQTTLLASQLLTANARNEQLIEGLLVLSQANQGLAARTPQALDTIAERLIETSAAAAAKADVKITTDLRPYVVRGDGVLLERLVRNLLHNAIKYNHPGGTVRLVVGAEDAALSVVNTGPVIPAGDVARLFEPFTRLASGRIDHSGGSGLGLAIARSIVQAHDGTISATPSDGGGLHFTVALPRA